MKRMTALAVTAAIPFSASAAANQRFCSPEGALVIAGDNIDFQPKTIGARDVGVSRRALASSKAFIVAMAYHSKSVVFVPDAHDHYAIAKLPDKYLAWTGWKDCGP